MLQNILRLKSGSLGAKLFACQEVRVPGLLGFIVLCSWARHPQSYNASLHPGVTILGVTLLWTGN